MKVNVIKEKNYIIVYFELGSNLTPDILKTIKLPTVDDTIWFYCYFVHHYHPTKFTAACNPRLGSTIIVETHTKECEIGNIIKIEEGVIK